MVKFKAKVVKKVEVPSEPTLNKRSTIVEVGKGKSREIIKE